MAKAASDGVFALLLAVLLLLPSGSSSAFELSFDDSTAGFFIRDKANPTASVGNDNSDSNVLAPSAEESGKRDEKILQASRFTSVRRSSPLSLRASYGPFRVSQTVPAAESFFDAGMNTDDKAKTADKDPHVKQIELSAHLVTPEVPKDRPTLRVLFHVGRHSFRPSPAGPSSSSPSSSSDGTESASRICVVVHADLMSSGGEMRAGMRRSARCAPSATDATCLAEIQLPSSWWPSLTPMATATAADAITAQASFGATKTKQPKVSVRVSYAAFKDHTRSCEKRSGAAPVSASVETTRLATVALNAPSHGYTQLGHDDIVHMLMPQAPKFPNSNFFVPVFLENTNKDKQQIEGITVTCRTKPGVRVLGVEENPLLSASWNIVSEINARGSVATVKATKKTDKTETAGTNKNVEGPQELYSWLLHVDEKDMDDWTKTRLTWHVSYRTSTNQTGHLPETGVDQFKIRSKLTVQKDEVQAVLPIVKDSELLNVAVLTGRQVSRPLKVLIVSESGEIADVTIHSSCSSTDESAFKVTASCTSFYLDGSETRGALSAAIAVQYGSRSGSAVVTVWMPETPLRVEMDDSRLSQISGWKTARAKSRAYAQRREAATPVSDVSEVEEKKAKEASVCGPRYQQSKVRVLARFLAEDPDTGRKDFFPSRGVELDVTDLLVGHALRLEDSAVAAVTADVVEGIAIGKTDLQVISPITGQVLGRHEVQVLKSKESVSGMNVRLLTGLQLTMTAQPNEDRRIFSASAAFTSDLNKKYQEGLLDVELLFSDDTTVRLGDVSPDDFRLAVHSLDPKVIAFAPTDGARHLRVIAVGSGRGPLLEVELRPAPDCEDADLDAEAVLAEATVEVAVRIADGKERDAAEDGGKTSGRRGLSVLSSGTQAVNMGDLGDALTNVALRDDYRYQPAISGGTRSGTHQQQQQLLHRAQSGHAHVTPLEIGMYALLAVFCAAITVFIGSCFVYASRFQRQQCISVPATIQPIKSQSVQNAHGWVWLGRATMDKTSLSMQSGGTFAWRDANTLVMCEAAVPTPAPTATSKMAAAPRREAPSLSQRRSQRLSYVGSEINIIPNPHTDEYEAEVSTPSSPDETPTAVVCQELPRRRASNSNHNHNNHNNNNNNNNNPSRPPNATPARRLRSVEEDRHQERAYLMAESSFAQDLGLPMTAAPARLPPEYRRPRRLPPSPTPSVPHPATEIRVAGDTARSAASSASSSSSSRPPINTATYTKRNQMSDLDEGESRPLALVFPEPSATSTSAPRSPPLRQSPASALPPYIAMDDANSNNHMFLDLRPSYMDGVDETEDCGEDASMLNPALDMPSPPCNGDRTFSLGLAPVTSPEKAFDSSTFTKSNSPSSSSLHDEIEPAQEPAPAKDDDEALAMGMDYEQLMTYFESLRESSA